MLVLDMLFVVSAVLFDMLKARQLACVSKSGQKCPAALSLSSWRAWIEIGWWRASDRRRSGRSPHGERGLKSVSASFWPPRGCCSPCLCPVFPAHAGFHMCGTASNGKPGFLSARGDFNGNTSRNCDWVFRMGSLLKAM